MQKQLSNKIVNSIRKNEKIIAYIRSGLAYYQHNNIQSLTLKSKFYYIHEKVKTAV